MYEKDSGTVVTDARYRKWGPETPILFSDQYHILLQL